MNPFKTWVKGNLHFHTFVSSVAKPMSVFLKMTEESLTPKQRNTLCKLWGELEGILSEFHNTKKDLFEPKCVF